MKFDDRALCQLTSGLLAGTGFAITSVTIPAIKGSSDPLPAFKRLYKNGSKAAVTLIILSTGLSLKVYVKTEDVRYLLAAGIFALIPPYTIFLMKSTNDELFSIKDTKYLEDEEETSRVRKLITKWDKLQYGRTAMGIIGFGIVCWIASKKPKSF